jgi:UDP-N-acetylmuramate--alanine ligase
MLAERCGFHSIAVAGSHGNDDDVDDCVRAGAGGLDPTAVIGGRVSAFGSNARLGRGELMVAEADESDRTFRSCFRRLR